MCAGNRTGGSNPLASAKRLGFFFSKEKVPTKKKLVLKASHAHVATCFLIMTPASMSRKCKHFLFLLLGGESSLSLVFWLILDIFGFSNDEAGDADGFFFGIAEVFLECHNYGIYV